MGFWARGEIACSVCATISLPVPGSPVISTFASDGPTFATSRSTGCIAGASAISVGRSTPRSSRFSASSRRPLRSARLSSICVRRMLVSRSFSQGFWMKSRAPRRMASTATLTLLHAVITTTGIVLSSAWILDSRSSPSCPDVVSRA